MRFSRTSKALGMVAIAALALTGCGAGGSATGSGSTGGDTSKVILADGSEPQRPLMPADTNEVGGGKVIDMMFAGLVSYDPSGKPVNELAESIEGKDGQHFTIKVKKDQKFTQRRGHHGQDLRRFLELRRRSQERPAQRRLLREHQGLRRSQRRRLHRRDHVRPEGR